MAINFTQRELYHHGILGQKWGRRQGPPYPLDAGDHSAAEKSAGYKKSLGGGRNESLYERGHKRAQKDKSDFSRYKKYGTKEEEQLRKKQSKLDQKKQRVKDYEEAYNRASELSDQADEMFREAKEIHKSLAKTTIGRAREVYKDQIGNGSAAAKEYSRKYEEAMKLSSKADKAWKEADEKYAKLGKTYAARVITNAKYGEPVIKKGSLDKAFNKAVSKQSSKNSVSSKMKIDPSDSAVTKRVKNDYNNLTDQEFMRKYSTSKETYKKRVDKYGDPYMNAPLAKLGKRLASK